MTYTEDKQQTPEEKKAEVEARKALIDDVLSCWKKSGCE